MSDESRELPDEEVPTGADPETGEPTDVDADDVRAAPDERAGEATAGGDRRGQRGSRLGDTEATRGVAGTQRRGARPRHAGPQTDGPPRPRVQRQDTSVRGGVIGITAVIAATALLTLAGVLVSLVVALLY